MDGGQRVLPSELASRLPLLLQLERLVFCALWMSKGRVVVGERLLCDMRWRSEHVRTTRRIYIAYLLS